MFSSLGVFICIFLKSFYICNILVNYLFLIFIVLKIGIMPFHQWAFRFANSLDFGGLFLFLGVIKIIPLFIIMKNNNEILHVLFYINMIFSVIFLFKFNSYWAVIFFSSIFLTSLFFFLLDLSNFFNFISLVLIYNFLSFLLIRELKNYIIKYVFRSFPGYINLSFFIVIIRILGIPYSLGFLLKILFIQSMGFGLGAYTSLLFLFLGSSILCYHYIKILYFYFIARGGFYSNFLIFYSKFGIFSNSFLLLGAFILPLFSFLGTLYLFYLK